MANGSAERNGTSPWIGAVGEWLRAVRLGGYFRACATSLATPPWCIWKYCHTCPWPYRLYLTWCTVIIMTINTCKQAIIQQNTSQCIASIQVSPLSDRGSPLCSHLSSESLVESGVINISLPLPAQMHKCTQRMYSTSAPYVHTHIQRHTYITCYFRSAHTYLIHTARK
jgi:hypothetical protein